MSSTVSPNGKDAGKWLLDVYETQLAHGVRGVQHSRRIIQLIADHIDDCWICGYLDGPEARKVSGKDLMVWSANDPIFP